MSSKDGNSETALRPSMLADLTGRQFGELTVKQRLGLDDEGIQIWLCQCACGQTAIITQTHLLSGKTKHCASAAHHKRLIDLTGQRFGRLTVLRQARQASSSGNARWLCQCDCGNFTEVDSYNLRRGITKSCGCLRIENSRALTQHNNGFREHMGNAQTLKNDDGIYISSVNLSKRNHTGVIGVSYDKSNERWVARLRFRGRYVLNKACQTFEEAAELRHAAERRYLGKSN